MKELDSFNNEMKNIIEQIKVNNRGEFSSHEFIKKFSKSFQKDYIEMLYWYRDTGCAFKMLHGQIAKHLSLNMDSFNIHKTNRKESEDIFGDTVEVQWWKKI